MLTCYTVTAWCMTVIRPVKNSTTRTAQSQNQPPVALPSLGGKPRRIVQQAAVLPYLRRRWSPHLINPQTDNNSPIRFISVVPPNYRMCAEWPCKASHPQLQGGAAVMNYKSTEITGHLPR